MTPPDAKTQTPTLAHHLEPGTGHTLTPARALRAVGHYLDRERPVAVDPDPTTIDASGAAATKRGR
jgi:hypothetical protein